MSKFCFKLGDSEKEFCIPIYKEKFPKKPDPEWKRKHFEDLNEHFDEVIKSGIIKKELVADVAILSSIKQLSSQLSPELAVGFNESIKKINYQVNEMNSDFNLKI